MAWPSGRGSAWRGVVSVALRGVGNLSNLPRWPRGAQPLAITGNLTRLIARDCSAIKRAISARASGGELRLTCAVSRGKRAARGQGESVSGVVRREARRAAGGHKLEDNLWRGRQSVFLAFQEKTGYVGYYFQSNRAP